MMERVRECKSCRTTVVEGIQDIDHELDDDKTVSEEVYQNRLDTCMECPSLAHGSTCKFSGCLVSFRAYLIEKKCPDPSGDRWS
ncbi:hypothetical protein JCM9157_994 [Halalkalibacter akibai JCM 9157]|uniref:Uncharacterized protein n=2 Tax=Halalkalibacter akibai TaxID=1411 RepID=W4QPI2_HALA3|nr:hypothetical protein JCM9157_994 [Halalkalibacter akibai JCM 9157]